MNRGIYATATGMFAAQQSMDVIANNLANASTVGFKRDQLGFDEAMLRQMGGDKDRIGALGAGPMSPRSFTIFNQGSLTPTKNPLDLAVRREHGMFAVQVGDQIQYTRDGSFSLDENRQLVTKGGYPVLDTQNQPITVPEGAISIAEDGTIRADDQPAGQIGVFDVERQDPFDLGFTKVGTNLFTANRPVRAVEGNLKQGALEASNVDAVSAMVEMISLSRAFEMAQRSVTQQDELTQRLVQSLSDR